MASEHTATAQQKQSQPDEWLRVAHSRKLLVIHRISRVREAETVPDGDLVAGGRKRIFLAMATDPSQCQGD